MRKYWPAFATLLAGGVIVVALNHNVLPWAMAASDADKSKAETTKIAPAWAAAAPGRVEPKGGEVNLGFMQPGLVKDVVVRVNDRVKAGDLLLRLEDNELIAKLAIAKNEVSLRLRDRDSEGASGLALDRRKAEDAVYAAEQDLFQARFDLDTQLIALKAAKGDPAQLNDARKAVSDAQDKLTQEQANWQRLSKTDKFPAIERREAALEAARADVRLLQIALEKGRLRAPFDATVLQVRLKAGEAYAPGGDTAPVVLGNLERLQVRVEVDEEDASKIHAGQAATVKTASLSGRSFQAHVIYAAPALSAPRLSIRGARRAGDMDIMEAVLELDEKDGLVVGMTTDVYFALDAGQGKTAAAKAN